MNPKNKRRPIHPGEVLREEFLLPLGSAHALALELRVAERELGKRTNQGVQARRAA